MTDTAFRPLPQPTNANGDPRLTGVEIELGGLPEDEVAAIVAEVLNGTAHQDDTTIWTVRDTDIGDVEVYLDTALRKASASTFRDAGLALGREVVPVEIVTDPLDADGLDRLDHLRAVLCDRGALGSTSAWYFGFGVHLNVEIASTDTSDILRPLLAYALIEDWMRAARPIDESRNALPFTDPYPTAFVRHLVELGRDASLSDLIDLYLEDTPSRNRGLDMLPIFAHLDEDRVTAKIGTDTAVTARPTFHFRLPDCRIDDPDWTLVTEWDRWRLVEQIAASDDLLDKLGAAYVDAHQGITLFRSEWAKECGKLLGGLGGTS
ncbi:MAG: amidoligase family protein [Pseudomonadota bacterium]|nr:amidoligase family protein [Pseudomonadota bacterium]